MPSVKLTEIVPKWLQELGGDERSNQLLIKICGHQVEIS